MHLVKRIKDRWAAISIFTVHKKHAVQRAVADVPKTGYPVMHTFLENKK